MVSPKPGNATQEPGILNNIFSFTAVKTAVSLPILLNNGSVSASLPW